MVSFIKRHVKRYKNNASGRVRIVVTWGGGVRSDKCQGHKDGV